MYKNKHYKRVFILGADVEKDHNGNYVMAENDKKGYPLLSEWRLMAAKRLWEERMVDKFVIVSYFQLIEEKEIWRCDVMKNILKDKYGIPENVIEVRKQSEKATIGNGIEIKRYLFDWSIKKEECAFLTNFYHIPRAVVLFHEINLFLRPLAAESFFIGEELKIREDYGKTKFDFFDTLISELRGMKAKEFGSYGD